VEVGFCFVFDDVPCFVLIVSQGLLYVNTLWDAIFLYFYPFCLFFNFFLFVSLSLSLFLSLFPCLYCFAIVHADYVTPFICHFFIILVFSFY